MTNHPTADLARFCAQLHYEDLSAYSAGTSTLLAT